MSDENEYLTTEPGTQMQVDSHGEVSFREEGDPEWTAAENAEELYPRVLEFPNLKFPGASTGYKVREGEVYNVEDDYPFSLVESVKLSAEVRKPPNIRRLIWTAIIMFLLYTIGQMVGTAWLVHVM